MVVGLLQKLQADAGIEQPRERTCVGPELPGHLFGRQRTPSEGIEDPQRNGSEHDFRTSKGFEQLDDDGRIRGRGLVCHVLHYSKDSSITAHQAAGCACTKRLLYSARSALVQRRRICAANSRLLSDEQSTIVRAA